LPAGNEEAEAGRLGGWDWYPQVGDPIKAHIPLTVDTDVGFAKSIGGGDG